MTTPIWQDLFLHDFYKKVKKDADWRLFLL